MRSEGKFICWVSYLNPTYLSTLRLAPEAFYTPISILLDIAPPFTEKLIIDGNCGCGQSPSYKFRIENTAESIISLIKDKVYEGFISFLTLEEILKAPHEIRDKLKTKIDESGFGIFEETEVCVELANAYLNDEIIPAKYRNDARHIALGVYYECEGSSINYVKKKWNYHLGI